MLRAMEKIVSFKSQDDELQIVYGAVYCPDVVDSHGDYMNAEEIRKMAHNFCQRGHMFNVDMNHDGEKTGAYVVETFISKTGDPDFPIPGTWVVGVHIPDENLWGAVKKGEINGFSMEAAVHTKDGEVEVPGQPYRVVGETKEAEDGHIHKFEAYFNEDGVLTGGRTSVFKDSDGREHSHDIVKNVVTEKQAGHAHRFLSAKIELLGAG
jgi:hypothetical protein